MRSFVLFIYGLSCGYGLLRPTASATEKSSATQLSGSAADAFVAAGSAEAVKELSHLGNDSMLQANMLTFHREIAIPGDFQKDAGIAEMKNNLSNEINEERGRRKRRKMLKYLQPILIGFLIMKFIIFPLVLKTLTALSTSSFVMSKIALAITGLLVLKWLISGSGDGGGYDGGAKDRTHLEIVHLPFPLTKAYHKGNVGGGGAAFGGWDDLASSGSSNVFAIRHGGKPHKYIPVNNLKHMAHVVAAATVADAADNAEGVYRNTRPVFDDKPFL
ncbi:PREDICTED: uncharacterized protein LOC108973989 [Bactrocera latifrons]|uniref:Uncharacterized protein n=1 Tax=Bactrocera latifrons TaxID=174628 RepID=A0A0K8UCM8_BACLA|nr:PREDICTED: uncharacterized protein LOC108973989 [Bactrocera latifrons]